VQENWNEFERLAEGKRKLESEESPAAQNNSLTDETVRYIRAEVKAEVKEEVAKYRATLSLNV